jgi:predicted phosphoadenosine phosphosulfate sulfurtransferase
MLFEEERKVAAADRPIPFAVDRVKYLDSDVLTEAYKRIERVIMMHDSTFVSFSGGKDSLVVAYLVREVFDRMGMQNVPVTLAFRDEELIPDDVIEFVQSFRERPDRWNLVYYAFPMESHLFFMGRHLPYVQWDEKRRGNWIRPKPDYAIEQIHPDNVPLHQSMTSALTVHHMGLKGRVAIFNGIRAQESLIRFRASTASTGPESYISGDMGGAKNVSFVKPIFDWSEKDVFRYFFDKKISYCKIYEAEMYAGAPLRVSTPLHDAAYDYLSRLRVMYPTFFEQIVAIWPEVAAQERYWKSFDRNGTIHRYPKSWEGMMQFIEENITEPREKKRAIEVVKQCRSSRMKNQRTGKYADMCGSGYPLFHVFKAIVTGKFMKGVQAHVAPDNAMIEYERQADLEAATAVRGA